MKNAAAAYDNQICHVTEFFNLIMNKKLVEEKKFERDYYLIME
jgi:hypothetical protein